MASVIRSCKLCGVEFSARSRASIYCSNECKTASNWGYSAPLTCAGCGKKLIAGATSSPQGKARCRDCRGYAHHPEHGVGGYYRGCRCDICRADKARSMREYYRTKGGREALRRRNAKRKVKSAQAAPACIACGRPALGSRRDRPCHKECRTSIPDYLWRGTPGPAQRRALVVIEKAARGTSGGGVWVSGPCAWCGEQFTGRGKAARFCSKNCATAAKFARKDPYTFKPSPALRLAVYERDNWTCQVCDLPVDPSEHFRSDWAGSLDHVIPQAAMLIPDHSESNLRLVHRICNAYRGDNTHMTDTEVRAIARARYAETQEVAA